MRTILILLLLLCVSVHAAGPATNATYTVNWRASTNVFVGSTNIVMQPDANLVFMTTNPALPSFQWTLVAIVPGARVVTGNPNYVPVTSASFNQPFSPPVFASVVYTNAVGSSAPLFSIGGLQGAPNDNPITQGITVGP